MGYAKDADTLNRTTCTREIRELATVAIGVKADREVAKISKERDNAVANCKYAVKRLDEADAEWSARVSAARKGATEQLNLLKRIRELSMRRDQHENCKITDAPCDDLESIERQYEAALDDYRKWEEAHPNA